MSIDWQDEDLSMYTRVHVFLKEFTGPGDVVDRNLIGEVMLVDKDKVSAVITQMRREKMLRLIEAPWRGSSPYLYEVCCKLHDTPATSKKARPYRPRTRKPGYHQDMDRDVRAHYTGNKKNL